MIKLVKENRKNKILTQVFWMKINDQVHKKIYI